MTLANTDSHNAHSCTLVMESQLVKFNFWQSHAFELAMLRRLQPLDPESEGKGLSVNPVALRNVHGGFMTEHI